MPRGENPNSKSNLKVLSPKEARKNGSKGGKRSAETRRELRSFRELDAEVTSNEERIDMLSNLKKRAKYNNKAFEIYRDTVGLKPSDKLEVSGLEAEKSKLDDILRQMCGDG